MSGADIVRVSRKVSAGTLARMDTTPAHPDDVATRDASAGQPTDAVIGKPLDEAALADVFAEPAGDDQQGADQ